MLIQLNYRKRVTFWQWILIGEENKEKNCVEALLFKVCNVLRKSDKFALEEEEYMLLHFVFSLICWCFMVDYVSWELWGLILWSTTTVLSTKSGSYLKEIILGELFSILNKGLVVFMVLSLEGGETFRCGLFVYFFTSGAWTILEQILWLELDGTTL